MKSADIVMYMLLFGGGWTRASHLSCCADRCVDACLRGRAIRYYTNMIMFTQQKEKERERTRLFDIGWHSLQRDCEKREQEERAERVKKRRVWYGGCVGNQHCMRSQQRCLARFCSRDETRNLIILSAVLLDKSHRVCDTVLGSETKYFWVKWHPN